MTPSDYSGVVIVSEAPLPGTPGADPVVLTPAPIDNGPKPRYQSHTPSAAQIEAGMTKNSQDEPNIGVNWSSGKVILQALMQTLQVGFNDQSCPQTPPSTWKDVTPVVAQESFRPDPLQRSPDEPHLPLAPPIASRRRRLGLHRRRRH